MTAESLEHVSFISFLKEFEPNILLTNTLLYYEGEVNHEITKALSYTTESQIKKNGTSRIAQKKIFNVMIECLQNIDKHTIEIQTNDNLIAKKGAILVAESPQNFFILAGNPVRYEMKETLTSIINNLNNREKPEIRNLYKKQLENGKLSEKGGAGLGFIDMSRKSGNFIEFAFYTINEDLLFFVYKIKVNK